MGSREGFVDSRLRLCSHCDLEENAVDSETSKEANETGRVGSDGPIRVLHVIHGFNTGGAETLVRDYLLKMQGPRIESRAVCFLRLGSPYESQLEENGVRVTYMRDSMPAWLNRLGVIGGPIRRVLYCTGLRREVRGWRPDVIHSHLPINRYVSFAVGRRGLVGHSGEPARLLHTVHNEPMALWSPEGCGLRTYIERRLDFRAASRLARRHGMRFIALHEGMKREVDSLFGVHDTAVVNNGIDFERFDARRSRAEVRGELGIPASAFVVGHVGRFAPQKNHAKVVSVFGEIRRRRPEAFLLLVGDGPLKGKVGEDLLRRGLDSHSLILSNRDDVPDLMGAMDSFLFPSVYEGLGIVLIEAQKVGLPCTVSDAVPSTASISNLVDFLSLDADDARWADAALRRPPSEVEYHGLEGWDMRDVVRRLEALYRGGEA